MRELCLSRKILRPGAAFLLSAVLLGCVFATSGLFPFGENTLAWGDMSQQVVPLLMELKDIMQGRANLLLNLQNAGGMSFWGVFFFFLASPFSFLVAFVEKGQIYLLVNLLVLVKLCLAAATASRFFDREAPGLAAPVHLALCVSYGLCGYALLYYQNLVWLDMLCLFPLILMGFMRLIEGKSSRLLTGTLIAALVVNYYLSYMVFLGMILCAAVFLRCYVKREAQRELAGKIGLSALTALGATAVVWLPSLLQCLASARTSGGLMDLVRTGSFWSSLTTTLPLLLCTAGASVLPALWFFFQKTSKLRAIALCWGLTVLPLVVEPVNKMWHMGSYQAFPGRYGYMPVLFGLWFLGVGLEQREERAGAPGWKKAALWALPLLAVAGAGMYLLLARYDAVSSYTSSLWVDAKAFGLLCLFWGPCMGAMVLGCRFSSRRAAGWLLLAVCMAQGLVQAEIFIGSAARSPSRGQAVVEAAPPEDAGLYRVKTKEKFFDVNLLGAAGHPTLNHYTSLTDSRFLAVMKKLGYSSYWMETSGCGGTGISDLLLSNKYSMDGHYLWTATGSGNLGYLLPQNVLPAALETENRFQVQDRLYQAVTGEAEGAFSVYRPVQGEAALGEVTLEPTALRYEIPVLQRETLYFDAFSCISTRLKEKINDGFHIKVNGQEIAASYPTQRQNGILELGTFENQKVSVEVTVLKRVELCSFGVYGLKAAKVRRLAEALGSSGLFCQKGGLGCQTEAEAGQALFLSVPWYQGTEVWVNGERVQPRIVLDCFMEIPLPAGWGEVELRYIPSGLRLGGCLSFATLALCVIFRKKRSQNAGKLRRAWYRAAPALLTAAFSAVILLVYVLPPALWILG